MAVKVIRPARPVIDIAQMRDWLVVIYDLIGDSIFDALTTMIAFGVVIAIIMQRWPIAVPWAVFTVGSVYFVLFLLRLIRKFQNEYSNDDLAERLAETKEEIRECIHDHLSRFYDDFTYTDRGSDQG